MEMSSQTTALLLYKPTIKIWGDIPDFQTQHWVKMWQSMQWQTEKNKTKTKALSSAICLAHCSDKAVWIASAFCLQSKRELRKAKRREGTEISEGNQESRYDSRQSALITLRSSGLVTAFIVGKHLKYRNGGGTIYHSVREIYVAFFEWLHWPWGTLCRYIFPWSDTGCHSYLSFLHPAENS